MRATIRLCIDYYASPLAPPPFPRAGPGVSAAERINAK